MAEKQTRLNKSGDEHTYLREAETLRQREHPNIVPLLASYTLPTIESRALVTNLHLIFPLAEMDLKDWMHLSQPPDWLQGLPEPKRRACLYRFIYGLVSCLSFLHREKDGAITAHHDLNRGLSWYSGKNPTSKNLGSLISAARTFALWPKDRKQRAPGSWEHMNITPLNTTRKMDCVQKQSTDARSMFGQWAASSSRLQP